MSEDKKRRLHRRDLLRTLIITPFVVPQMRRAITLVLSPDGPLLLNSGGTLAHETEPYEMAPTATVT